MNSNLRHLLARIPEDNRKSLVAERSCYDGNKIEQARFDRELENRLLNQLREERVVEKQLKRDSRDRKRMENWQTA